MSNAACRKNGREGLCGLSISPSHTQYTQCTCAHICACTHTHKHSFLESKQQEHGRRHFFPLPGQSVQWHTGEFLCPLCQCFSNTVLPLLPRLKCPPEARPPSHDISLSEWREMVRMAVELGQTVVEEEGTMDQGTVVQHLW